MSNIVPQKENICAIIVTYFPDANFTSRVKNIAKQVNQVIIIDNHSDDSYVKVLQDLSYRLSIHLILNSDNVGVATALNQGMTEVKKQGYAWALLLDQDTDPTDSMVELLIDTYNSFPQKDILAVIGSNYFNAINNKTNLSFKDDSEWAEQKTVITSGSLISLKVFEIVGCFRDQFFIDHVDDEYCLRARSKGFKIIMTRKPAMTHTIGNVKIHRLLWRKVGTSNHAAFRRYYMTRNHIVLVREYWSKELSWVLTTLYFKLKSILLMCLFEKSQLKKLKFIVIGFFDGCVSNFRIVRK